MNNPAPDQLCAYLNLTCIPPRDVMKRVEFHDMAIRSRKTENHCLSTRAPNLSKIMVSYATLDMIIETHSRPLQNRDEMRKKTRKSRLGKFWRRRTWRIRLVRGYDRGYVLVDFAGVFESG